MHYLDCGQAPASLQKLVKTNQSGQPVWDPDPKDYAAFIEDLSQRFSGFCAYCERQCERPPKRSGSDERQPVWNAVDHFRPRDHFRHLMFEWENLMYVCDRCNSAKGNKFPGITTPNNIDLLRFDALRNGKQWVGLSQDDGYVNPRDPNDRAETFLVYDEDCGVDPNNDLDDLGWTKARLTIHDLDLNPVGGPRARDLSTLRREQFFFVYAAIWRKRKSSQNVRLNRDTVRTQPFSSFILWAESSGWFENVPNKVVADYVTDEIHSC